MKSLATLKTVAQAWVDAEKRYKATPTSKRLENEAQNAFGEFVAALDGRTVLSLIDQIETMKHVADNFVWLAQNSVTGTTEAGIRQQTLSFTWRHPVNDPQTLGEAVRVAMQQKSPILRVAG